MTRPDTPAMLRALHAIDLLRDFTAENAERNADICRRGRIAGASGDVAAEAKCRAEMVDLFEAGRNFVAAGLAVYDRAVHDFVGPRGTQAVVRQFRGRA